MFEWDKILQSSGYLPCILEKFDNTVVGVARLSCAPAVFTLIVRAALLLAGAAAVFLIVFSGIKFITSGGDAKQVEAAQHTLTYAVIGLIVILASFFVVYIIAQTTGLGCITMFGFNSCPR